MPKITALPPAAAITTDDLLAIVDAPGTVPVTQKATIAQLVTLLNTIYAPVTGGAYVLKAGDTMTGLLQFSGTGHFGLRLNNLTTAQRDAIGVGVAGNTIFNTTNTRFEFNIGGGWATFVRLDGDTMTSSLLFSPDNAATIGLAGATRPATGYFGTSVIVGLVTTSGVLGHGTFGKISFASDGVFSLLDNAGTSFSRLNFGGVSSSFPSIVRSGSGLEIRVAASSGVGGVLTSLMADTINSVRIIVGTGTGSVGIEFSSGTGKIKAPSNGVFLFTDDAGTSFGRIQFGGTTSAFPSIKRSTTLLQVRLADDSAYAPFEANTVRTATAYTVATLPAAGSAGRRAYVTDATTPAYGVALVGGGAVNIGAYDNGVTWIAG